jgi:hypothetical protein
MTVEVRGRFKNERVKKDDGALFGAVVGRRGTLDVSSAADDARACAFAVGTETGWVLSGKSRSSVADSQKSVFPLFCDTPLVAAEHAGFIAVRVALGRSLGQISARAAPAARGAAPAATAAGGASVNAPVFVTGKDLPGFGESAWCVSRGGAFETSSSAYAEEDVAEVTKKSAAFVPATAVSSALVACPPPEFPFGARSGDFSSSPARLEIVPADVAAGAPTGGAFYAKSSVELDVEAHGEAAPGAAGAMAVGGGGGGGGASAAARFFFVPEEGGATVFVRPGGARVAPSGCDFGTITGVAARHAHAHAEERPPGGEEETWGFSSSGPIPVEPAKNSHWFACVSPAMRARRDVPTRAAFPSRSRRDADDVGHVTVRRLELKREDERGFVDRAFVDDPTKRGRDVRHSGATRGARLALPAAATFHGGSPASVALGAVGGGGVGVPFFCVFAADATAGFETRRVVVRVAAVLSAILVRCETPPPFEWAPPRGGAPDVARGAVEAASAAEAFRETSPTTTYANADAAVFAWVVPPALESAAPRSGPAEGGVLVSLFGSGLNGGARPAAWFGAVGPVACRVAGDADAASDAAAEKTKRFVFLSCVSPASAPTRAFAGGTPAPLSASATGDAQTRSAFGFGVTYAALHTDTRGVSGLKTSPGDASRRGHGAAAAAKRRETPETRVVVAPAAAPVGGGAVLWLYGSGFRNGVTERAFEPSAGFAFVSLDTSGDDGRYFPGRASSTRVGACVPVSSALAACEAPSLAFPTRHARARFAFAEKAEKAEGVAHGLDGASLAVAAPASVSRVAPAAVPAGGGAAVLARLSAPAAASARLGCVFGSVGPAAGRFAAEARDALSCVAPAHAPSLSAGPVRGSRTLVPVAVTGAGSGAAYAWADAGAFPGVRDAPRRGVRRRRRGGRRRSVAARLRPSLRGGGARARGRARLRRGRALPARRRGRGRVSRRRRRVRVRRVSGRRRRRARRIRSGGDADFGISCVFGPGALSAGAGFRAAWVTFRERTTTVTVTEPRAFQEAPPPSGRSSCSRLRPRASSPRTPPRRTRSAAASRTRRARAFRRSETPAADPDPRIAAMAADPRAFWRSSSARHPARLRLSGPETSSVPQRSWTWSAPRWRASRRPTFSRRASTR